MLGRGPKTLWFVISFEVLFREENSVRFHPVFACRRRSLRFLLLPSVARLFVENQFAPGRGERSIFQSSKNVWFRFSRRLNRIYIKKTSI